MFTTHSSTGAVWRVLYRGADVVMQVGLALPPLDLAVAPQGSAAGVRWQEVRGWARLADDLGFDPLWVSDDGPDPLVVLGALARTTSRARLGAGFEAGRRSPAVLAKALSTVDVVSGGRLVVGLQAGSGVRNAGETPGIRTPEPSAPELLDEACQVLVGMFGGGPFSFAGDHVQVVGARCLPVPVQRPHPPIWVAGDGGGGDELHIMARRAGGWYATGHWTPPSYRRALDSLEAACDRAGRDPATVTRGLVLPAPETSAEVTARINEWETAGVDTVILEPAGEGSPWSDPGALAMLAAACSLEAP